LLQRFSLPRIAPQHITLLRADHQRKATICLSIYRRSSPRIGSPQLGSPHLRNMLRLSIQRNELKLN